MQHITEVTFLNRTDAEDSLGRLGMSTLKNAVSAPATVALARLSCQAHGIEVTGMGRDYDKELLEELHSIRLIFWPGGSEVKLV